MKKAAFIIYTWGSTVLFGLLIYWLATLPNFQAGDQVSDELIKVIFRMILYSIFFILIYRSIILTLKTTVDRLASYRSKGEKSEDAEFVLIIETLVVIITIVSCILFGFFEEHTQFYVNGRNGNETYLISQNNGNYVKSGQISKVAGATYINLDTIGESTKDILITTMSVLLTGIVVYSLPVIGELEVAIKHKIEQEIKQLRGKKK
jgi:hypothetical protein